ncbi:MAG TPA: serine/threonine-protein kinase [Trueperaceae bacterium]|nr:serine/threonine-protein kinase [Trueperaceae bacterium]
MRSDPEAPAFVPAGYTVLHKLGSGQTSHVYLAKHRVFGDVALKLPRAELQEQPVLRRMFENEVSITVKLAHPMIVAAFDGYPTGSGAFLALEYCAGGTLDLLLLEKGKLPLEQSYRLVLDVARGLAHTHERSVIHRDVKPANVFLTKEGTAKLGDFGTGVFMGEDSEERVGTAFYMAPEVFEGKAAGVRSDIYSLGVLAYEVIAGARPFVADTFEALMIAHHTDVPKDLMAHRPDLDPRIKRIVAKAMARDPEKRYASAKEFVQAWAGVIGVPLEVTQTSEEPTTGRASRQRTSAVGDARDDRPGRDGGDREKGEERGRQDRPRGLFGWLRRNRD